MFEQFSPSVDWRDSCTSLRVPLYWGLQPQPSPAQSTTIKQNKRPKHTHLLLHLYTNFLFTCFIQLYCFPVQWCILLWISYKNYSSNAVHVKFVVLKTQSLRETCKIFTLKYNYKNEQKHMIKNNEHIDNCNKAIH
jgi:hypothetical protein